MPPDGQSRQFFIANKYSIVARVTKTTRNPMEGRDSQSLNNRSSESKLVFDNGGVLGTEDNGTVVP